MNVWTPYGWKIMLSIDGYIRRYLDATNHNEVCFPLLIPETEFKKEKEHIKGFDAEVYWVTHAGLNELDIPLCLRPTSRDGDVPDLRALDPVPRRPPAQTYQIVNTFRYETKTTRAVHPGAGDPLLRGAHLPRHRGGGAGPGRGGLRDLGATL